MEAPLTPTTRESSSSPDLDVTPPSNELSSPFTRPSTISTGSELKKKSHMTFSKVAGESPSLRKDRGPLPQTNLNAIIEETPTYRAPQFRNKPISMHERNHEAYRFVPQNPMSFKSNVAGPATPAYPIRQPIAPPPDHAASSRSLFPGALAPSPAIWEGLKGHFSQLGINEHQSMATPTTLPPSQIPLAPIQEAPRPVLPSWLEDALKKVPYVQSQDGNHQKLSLAARQQNARGFRPMAAITRPASHTACEDEARESVFSDNYKGEHNTRNASALSLTPEQNCALWLTNLPPDVTHHELLGQIRNVGRIWCSVINEPDWERHETAAAKVVFFTPGPAQLLLSKSLTQGISVRGFPVRVTHNRVKYGEQGILGPASRVLIITGKSTFVNPSSLTEFFEERFVFEVDEITELIVQGDASKGGRSVVEYRFGSFRCQAQMGKMALEKDRPQGFEKVEFGEDPCEVGDTLSAYGVAAERIQGKGM
ncbi:uncharacterized protein FPRO_13348 [Fusarium proliferatum ET1]|uniref:RRM domain-containing protein n=1 Tax=Fusarium proliferatum (strain ET1) TaxID=1227346 RepID=A0A1L7W5Q1_FUSPR|nr:uncharacterized protein FPRO_13348 [Fusarium proliferatum ET1]CZR47681.1 uncharacterized protein FPRO_13348 [Fusarium proliferatum ET1]